MACEQFCTCLNALSSILSSTTRRGFQVPLLGLGGPGRVCVNHVGLGGPGRCDGEDPAFAEGGLKKRILAPANSQESCREGQQGLGLEAIALLFGWRRKSSSPKGKQTKPRGS